MFTINLKIFGSFLFFLLTVIPSNAQKSKTKLVVGIVVDQMRYDYLNRFEEHYGKNGFKRLIDKGFSCSNNHYDYIPTYTGPGHASIFTGTTPKYHGIIANNWYDKYDQKMVYCASDDSVSSVGIENSKAGEMSPIRMNSTTFCDENKLFTQNRSKSIGISLKDRGAILPIGHTANAAYWFLGKKQGDFISSSYYFDELPNWVNKFNNSSIVSSYLKKWDTLYPIESYIESGEDLNTFEKSFTGKKEAVFPYDLKKLNKVNGGFDILKSTPFGNSLLTDFAIEVLKNEKLGQGNVTDILTISYSSTDYVGHKFGVNSKEVQDSYIRLDKDIERILLSLDKLVGKGKYTVFLTADHGAVNVPSYLKSQNIPAGYLDLAKLKEDLNKSLLDKFGKNEIIENISNNQIFLTSSVKKSNLFQSINNNIKSYLLAYNGVKHVYDRQQMINGDYTEGIEALLKKGFNQKFSGDIIYVTDTAVISYGKKGSTHGSGMNYDTHVPLIFYGAGIKRGKTFNKTHITDIAPTISALLGISFPNNAIGNPIEMVLK